MASNATFATAQKVLKTATKTEQNILVRHTLAKWNVPKVKLPLPIVNSMIEVVNSRRSAIIKIKSTTCASSAVENRAK